MNASEPASDTRGGRPSLGIGALMGFQDLLRRSEQFNVPLSALIELTGRCNLDCKHCYLDLKHPPPELSQSEFCDIIDQLADAGTFFLTLSGGEIFLRKDTLAIAEHARRRGLALRLFTNATRIDRVLAAEIARLRPMAVEVSLYASHADQHAQITQRKRSFRSTLRGVVLLRQAGVRVGLKSPMMALTIDEMETLFRMGDRLGCRVAIDPTVHTRRDGSLGPATLRVETERLAAALAHPRLGLSAEKLPPPMPEGEIPCAIARRTCRIGPSGDVFPCPTYPLPVGNLRTQSFHEIWHGATALDDLRAIRVKDLRGECSGCAQSGYCSRCLASALIEQGDLFGPDREACRVAEAKELAVGQTPLRPGLPRPTIRRHLPVIA